MLDFLGTSIFYILIVTLDFLGTSFFDILFIFLDFPHTLLFDILFFWIFMISAFFIYQLRFRIFLMLWFLIFNIWLSIFHMFSFSYCFMESFLSSYLFWIAYLFFSRSSWYFLYLPFKSLFRSVNNRSFLINIQWPPCHWLCRVNCYKLDLKSTDSVINHYYKTMLYNFLLNVMYQILEELLYQNLIITIFIFTMWFK